MNQDLTSLLEEVAKDDSQLAGSGDNAKPIKLKADGTLDRRQFNAPSHRFLSMAEKEACRSKLEPDADSLHNAVVNSPFYDLKREKPEHRLIIFLKAEGHSNKEIAALTGYSPVSVSNVLRQPWAQRRLVDEITKAGRSEVEYLLKGAASDAVGRLINEMDNDTSGTATTRITAADKLLDRIYGKPNQPVTHSEAVDINKLSDAQIAERIAKLESQQQNRS